MSDVVAARAAYLAARERVKETKLALGRAIKEARPPRGREHNPPAGTFSQADIAAKLGLTREQVRRFEADYDKATAES